MTVVASLVAGAAGGWFAGRESADSSNTTASGATVPSTRTVSAELSGDDLDVAAILAKVGPSVVAVNTQVTQRRGPYIAQGQGAGTGVVLTADGQILTNAHVIDGATAITVSVEGSDQQLPATLVARDTANDLALLQVTGVSDLTPATLEQLALEFTGDTSALDRLDVLAQTLAGLDGTSARTALVQAQAPCSRWRLICVMAPNAAKLIFYSTKWAWQVATWAHALCYHASSVKGAPQNFCTPVEA